MKTRETFTFLPLINNLVTIGWSFYYYAYQQSNKIKYFFYQYFSMSIEYSIKALQLLECIKP